MKYKLDRHYICKVCNKTIDSQKNEVLEGSKIEGHDCQIGDLIEVVYGYPSEEEEVKDSGKNS
jgi:hypothetical protein